MDKEKPWKIPDNFIPIHGTWEALKLSVDVGGLETGHEHWKT